MHKSTQSGSQKTRRFLTKPHYPSEEEIRRLTKSVEKKSAVRDAFVWRVGNEKRHMVKGFPGFAPLFFRKESYENENVDNFHIRTVYLDIIKVLFIHQLMHK